MVVFVAPSIDAVQHWNLMHSADLVRCCAELFAPVDVPGADDSYEVALLCLSAEPVFDCAG